MAMVGARASARARWRWRHHRQHSPICARCWAPIAFASFEGA